MHVRLFKSPLIRSNQHLRYGFQTEKRAFRPEPFPFIILKVFYKKKSRITSRIVQRQSTDSPLLSCFPWQWLQSHHIFNSSHILHHNTTDDFYMYLQGSIAEIESSLHETFKWILSRYQTLLPRDHSISIDYDCE